MGGIGKTTLAAAVYVKLYSQFDGHCFLENVREEFKKGLNYVLEKLLSKLLEEENLFRDAPKVESLFVMRRLRRKRVFIVLDDVATSEQLEELIRDYDLLGQGSRVIVTTRDKHVFSKVNEIYEVNELNFHDSLQLFCLNAFGEKHPKIGYEELTKCAIMYCKGIPLALKVLGAHLRSRSKEAWKSCLRKLQKIPDVNILKVLRSSYDDLDPTEKYIFLDIACFFKGMSVDHVTMRLEAFDFYAVIGIEVLLDKALITISNNNIEMHHLIQEMGWEIVRQECIDDPGRRSRLFDVEEVCDVLKNNKGTEAVEGIILDVSKIRELHLSSNAFAKMPHIRFLKFYCDNYASSNIYLPHGLESLPNKLKCLQWDGYCLQSLPATFGPEKLVMLIMPHSHLEKLWNGVQNLVNLKKIEFSHSKSLIEVPDLSMATNLEYVYLGECKSLREVHPSILSLHKLKILYLEGCTKIESIRSNVPLKSLLSLNLNNCSSLKEFSLTSEEMNELRLGGTTFHEPPSSIWLNKKLTSLSLNGCQNLKSLRNKLHDDSRVGSLTHLDLSGCKQLNESNLCFLLDGLQSLKSLDLKNCTNLLTLPDNIGLLSSLQTLNLSGSNVQSWSANIKNLSMLEELILDNCRKLVSLPELPPSLKMLSFKENEVESLYANIKNLFMLEKLVLDNCRKLVSLPELPPSLKILSAINCTSLETTMIPQMLHRNISFSLGQGHQHLGEKYAIFPGGQVPEELGFCPAQTLITNVRHRPQSDLRGFIYYLIFTDQSVLQDYYIGQWNIPEPGQSGSDLLCTVSCGNLSSDHVYLGYCDIGGLPEIQVSENGYYNIAFEMKLEDGCSEDSIKGGGVCLVYASDYDQKAPELEPNEAQSSGCMDILEDSSQSEDDQESTLVPRNRLEQRMHQTITDGTDVQNGNQDLGEKSPCDCFIGLLLKHLWRLMRTGQSEESKQ